jgi:hypothetical protein
MRVDMTLPQRQTPRVGRVKIPPRRELIQQMVDLIKVGVPRWWAARRVLEKYGLRYLPDEDVLENYRRKMSSPTPPRRPPTA